MHRSAPSLLLALPLLLLPVAGGAQTVADLELAVSPTGPTTADLVEITVTGGPCPQALLPAAVEVGADGVIAVELTRSCSFLSPGSPSLAVGPLAAGTYPVEVTLDDLTTVLGEVTVVEGAAPPDLGGAPYVRPVPGRNQFEVTVPGVTGILGCPSRAVVVDEVRYEGAVAHVVLRLVPFTEGCSGLASPGDVTVAVTPQPDVFSYFYSVAVWLDEPGGEGPRAVATVHTRSLPPCAGSAVPILCLADGRFEVWANWTTADGAGPAHPLPLTTDTGAFWFFRPENLELTVKVLDACAAFDRFWVFVSGMTNQGVEIRVIDRETRAQRIYRNDLGEGFEAIRDTDAFATCDAP